MGLLIKEQQPNINVYISYIIFNLQEKYCHFLSKMINHINSPSTSVLPCSCHFLDITYILYLKVNVEKLLNLTFNIRGIGT